MIGYGGEAGELWADEHNITGAAGRRTKSKEAKRLLCKMDFAIVSLLCWPVRSSLFFGMALVMNIVDANTATSRIETT